MAVRIENGAVENFGDVTASTTITHFRGLIGSAVLFTATLTTQRTIAAGRSAEFAIGELDVLFPSADLDDAGYNALLALALNGTNAVTIKLMTSSTVEVADSGYSDRAVTSWTRANETDP